MLFALRKMRGEGQRGRCCCLWGIPGLEAEGQLAVSLCAVGDVPGDTLARRG